MDAPRKAVHVHARLDEGPRARGFPTPQEEFFMTKADLVQKVADQIGPGVTKRDCAVVVDAFLNSIKDAMGEHQNIEIRGFGTFKVRERKSRLARNPRTGDPVEVPPRAVPVFKPSKELRALVEERPLV
jgi:integration host factor subunit beta